MRSLTTRLRAVAVIVAASLFAPSSLTAQSDPRPLTLDEALTMTLAENPAVKAARYEERAAEQNRRAAIGLRMPQIGVTGAYTHLSKDIGFDLNGMKPSVQNAAGQILGSGLVAPEQIPTIQGLIAPLMGADWFLKVQDRNLGFVGGEVTLPIWMGGKINAANRAARLQQNLAEAKGDGMRNALVSELVERYFGLALARQVVEVRREVTEGMRHHLRDAEALERSGVIAASERLYVAFKLAEAEREEANAELEARTIAAALANTLGTAREWEPMTAMFLLDAVEPLDHYMQLAEVQNPLLDEVKLQHSLSKEALRAQRAAFMPQVVAMGGGSFYNYQVAGLVPRWAVGVGVSFKLFDGLNREYKYSAARHTVRRVGELRNKAEQDIAVLVEKLYNQLLNDRNRIISIESSIAFAEEYLRMKEAAFREGICSSSDLIDAELNLAAVRTERLQAAYHFDLTLARLLEASGISDEYAAYPRRTDARAILFDK